MSTYVHAEGVSAPARTEASRTGRVYRGILTFASAIAILAIVCHFAIMLWAQHEFAQPESVVAAQSIMLADHGTLYYGLKDYPFTVNAYMPIFYLIEAALIKTGLPAFTAGRLISFAALLGIFTLAWRITLLYTSDRLYAWLATLLCASTSLLLSWGTVAQVDTLAVSLALAGFYFYSRNASNGENTLAVASIFLIAAIFTKQTMLASPAAIFVLLCARNWKLALKFAAATGGIALALVLAINIALHGRFLLNTVFANINPFAPEKFAQHVRYIATITSPLILILAVGARSAFNVAGKALYVYLALAAGILALTAPKIGSDSNYQIEFTILVVLCSVIALHSLDFFGLLFRGSRSWITLLQLALAVYPINNFRLIESFLITRIAREQFYRAEIAELRPYIPADGRIISTDIDAMVHLRGRLDIEPLIYTLLVRSQLIDPEVVRNDLAHAAISTVVLYQDLHAPLDPDPELPTLPANQLDEIRKHYTLVAKIPGPYLDGVFVYKPTEHSAP